MSLGSIYYGDLTVSEGYSTQLHGLGDLRVHNKALIGVGNSIGSTGTSVGNLVVTGGVGIGENLYINSNLNVFSTSNLVNTVITGDFLVSSGSLFRNYTERVILDSKTSGTLLSSISDITVSSANFLLTANSSSSIISNGKSYYYSLDNLYIESTTGIYIGSSTTSNTNVYIGSSLSQTTIVGNLNVKGTTTTYDSSIVKIKDNFIQINNQPQLGGTVDGGLAIKRFQPANENTNSLLTGEIIGDIPDITGVVTGCTIGTNTIAISSGSLNTTTSDYYKGYWAKLSYNTNSWVRRIKTSNTNGTLSFYNTTDQTTVLGDPIPVEGLNLPTTGSFFFPDFPITSGSMNVSLYSAHWSLSMWDESAKEYSVVASNSVIEAPDGYTNVSFTKYLDFRAKGIKGDSITANTFNGSTADYQFLVTLVNNTTPVTLNTTGSTPTSFFLQNYGSYILSVKPVIDVDISPFAVFVGARRNKTSVCGQINRIVSVKGENNEMLDMDWPSNSYPRLMYTTSPGTIGNVQYAIKVVSV